MTDENREELEKMGWRVASVSPHGGEATLMWDKDGEPELPESVKEKIIGNKDGDIEYTFPL